MHKRLYEFLQEHNILFQNQYGFRKNRSTTYALLQITEKIKESIDNKKYGCGIFIDPRKAFDTVNHDILLRKLDHYGIRETALDWFKSYHRCFRLPNHQFSLFYIGFILFGS